MLRIRLPPSVFTPTDREPDALDAIMAIDNELVEWILFAQPRNDDEKREMRKVLELRTRLEQQVNKLILDRAKVQAAVAEAQIARLNAITAQIAETTKTIGTVKEVIGVADEAVSIAAQVLFFLV